MSNVATSLPAGSSATDTTPTVLDNGAILHSHSIVVTPTEGVSGGEVDLQVSHDGTNWLSASEVSGIGPVVLDSQGGPQSYYPAFNFPARYVQAVIIQEIQGGTIEATVASAS